MVRQSGKRRVLNNTRMRRLLNWNPQSRMMRAASERLRANIERQVFAGRRRALYNRGLPASQQNLPRELIQLIGSFL